MGYWFLFAAIVCNAVANVFLKLASGKPLVLSFAEGVGNLFASNAYLIAGVSLFAINVFFYISALRVLPLSVAYPLIVGGTFLIVSSAAVFFLGESFSVWHAAGYALILLGIMLVSLLGAA